MCTILYLLSYCQRTHSFTDTSKLLLFLAHTVPLLGKGLPPFLPVFSVLSHFLPIPKEGIQIVPPSPSWSAATPSCDFRASTLCFTGPPLARHAADMSSPVPRKLSRLLSHVNDLRFGVQYSVFNAIRYFNTYYTTLHSTYFKIRQTDFQVIIKVADCA
ncbi:hypothetical protein PYW08_012173 [Mythimna loreyi]|uniref:Uncharacterized protein n=1 Tax=Mythimna loreyi TaxID=667449 RepID=A0ACC2Q095_9NEOP|nr:hypothetical protein PYW08_012173 [Mythimna loreyi]